MSEQVPLVEIEFEVTRISEEDQLAMKNRKLDLGKWPVCSVCGQPVHSISEYSREPALHPNCKDSKRITLREYIETVKGEKFDGSKWKLEELPSLVIGDWPKSHKDDELTIGGA